MKLPAAFLSTFYVTFELYENGMLGKTCIGVAQVPVRQFIDCFLVKYPKLNVSYESILSADVGAPAVRLSFFLPSFLPSFSLSLSLSLSFSSNTCIHLHYTRRRTHCHAYFDILDLNVSPLCQNVFSHL